MNRLVTAGLMLIVLGISITFIGFLIPVVYTLVKVFSTEPRVAVVEVEPLGKDIYMLTLFTFLISIVIVIAMLVVSYLMFRDMLRSFRLEKIVYQRDIVLNPSLRALFSCSLK